MTLEAMRVKDLGQTCNAGGQVGAADVCHARQQVPRYLHVGQRAPRYPLLLQIIPCHKGRDLSLAC